LRGKDPKNVGKCVVVGDTRAGQRIRKDAGPPDVEGRAFKRQLWKGHFNLTVR